MMKAPIGSLAIVTLLILLLPVSGTTQEMAEAKNEAALRSIHSLVEKINIERTSRGIAPLKLQEELMRAAIQHVRDMAKFRYFAHATPHAPEGVEDYEEYPRQEHYRGQTGENLYRGEPRTAQIVRDWMASPEHRANLLDPHYCEVGSGFARGQDPDDAFCAVFFGIHPDIDPVVVNNEAYTTSSSTVRLYLYGRDTMKQMRFSSDGKTFTEWEPFRSEREWKLAPGEGVRTIYVEMSDGDTVFRASDSIVLAP